jgi:hypothetical protein
MGPSGPAFRLADQGRGSQLCDRSLRLLLHGRQGAGRSTPLMILSSTLFPEVRVV